jgi:hypothetical protein
MGEETYTIFQFVIFIAFALGLTIGMYIGGWEEKP